MMNKTATYKKGGKRLENTIEHQKKKAQKIKISWNSLSKSSATQDMFCFILAEN